MSRRHTLVLLQHAISDGRLLNICRTLLRHGDSVRVIAYGTPADTAKLQSLGIEAHLLDASTQPPLIKRWWRFLRFATATLRTCHSECIWAEDVFVFPAVVQHARKHFIPVIYDCRELFTLLPHIAHKPSKQKLILALERWGLQFTRLIVFTGELDIKDFQAIHPELPKIAVIENRPYAGEAATTPHIQDIRSAFGIDEQALVCMYQGGVFSGRGLTQCVHMLQEAQHIHLVIVGDGPEVSKLEELATEIGVSDRVHWVGRVPYTDLQHYTKQANVGLCLIEPVSRSYELAKPNKMFEYAASGIPGVYTKLPAMQEFVEQHKTGIVVETTCSPSDLADAVVRAAELNLEHSEEYVQQHFYWQGQEQELLRKLQDL